AEALAHRSAPADSIYTLAAAITSGHLQLSDNELAEATRTYTLALKLAGEPPHPMSAEAHLGLAEISYHRNDLDAATLHAQRCARLLWLIEKLPTTWRYHLFIALLEHAPVDVAGAAAAVDEATGYARDKGFDFQLPAVAAVHVGTLLRKGESAAAKR